MEALNPRKQEKCREQVCEWAMDDIPPVEVYSVSLVSSASAPHESPNSHTQDQHAARQAAPEAPENNTSMTISN